MSTSQASLKRKVAQLFTVVIPLINEEKEQFRVIEEYIDLGIGGLIIGMGGKIDFLTDFLQTNHVVDINKVREIISRLKRLDPTLFLAIDGEGGDKFNLFENVAQLKRAREYGLQLEQKGTTKGFERDISNYVAIMKECGINMNFAPVLDTAQRGYRGYMSEYGRSYSDRGETVETLSGIAIEEMQKNGIISVGKHFPGYGCLDRNPHRRLSSLKADNSNSNYSASSTFAHAIRNHGINGIMKGHVISPLDEKLPATLSPKVEKYLREKLGFNGLSVADEIFMASLNERYTEKGGDLDGTIRIVDAAKCNDILLVTYPKQMIDGKAMKALDKHDHFPRLHNAVYRAVVRGDIPEDKINSSYERIIRYKRLLGLGPGHIK